MSDNGIEDLKLSRAKEKLGFSGIDKSINETWDLDKVLDTIDDPFYLSIYLILKKLRITKKLFIEKFNRDEIELIFISLRSNCIIVGKNAKDFISNIINEQEEFLKFTDNEIFIEFIEPETLRIDNENIKLVNDEPRS